MMGPVAIASRRRYPADRGPDGELWFRRPDGRPLPDAPVPPRVPDDPVHTLRARNEAKGLNLDGRTTMPTWRGEPLHVGWAIDVLHPLAKSRGGRISSQHSKRP